MTERERLKLRLYEWMLGDDWGTSSKSLAIICGEALCGRMHVRRPAVVFPETPLDAADMGRCIRLVRRFPKLRGEFPTLTRKCPAWRPYVNAWDELEDLYDKDKDGLRRRMKEISRLRLFHHLPVRQDT